MCQACWMQAGAPTIDTPAVRAAAVLIAKVYEFSTVGGGLHVIVDDFNIEDSSILAGRFEREEDSAEKIAAETACLDALAKMTVQERASALALHDHYWHIRPETEPRPSIAQTARVVQEPSR